MLSDEEKKAIEILKDNIKSLEGPTPFKHTNYEKVQAIETILNLIEKQSKEIEELKKPKYIIDCKTGEIKPLANDFVSKDKIKAKIEDILNSENSEAIEKLIEWQSLLEKE